MKYRLDELFDLQMGKTPARKNPEYWNVDENKWISIADLSKCGKYINATKESISNKAVSESGIMQIPKNTVIMSFKLSIGKTAITSEPMYSNEAIISFRDKHVVEIMPEYLYYLILSKDWNAGTNKAVMGKTLNKATLSKVTVNIHNIVQQHKIVETLDKVNNVVMSRQQQLKKLDELVKSQFMELFGDPVTNTQGREVRPFKDFMLDIRYGTSQPPIFNEFGEFKFIRATNIKAGRIIENGMLRISADEAAKIEKCRLNGNEIIIVRSGANTGDTCVVTDEYRDQYAGYDIIITLNLEIANPVFFNELMNTHYMQAIIKPLTVRSAQPHINSEQVQNLPMLVVPLQEQEQFAAFVEQTDKSKFVIQQALDKAQLLFDSLMQKYFG